MKNQRIEFSSYKQIGDKMVKDCEKLCFSRLSSIIELKV